MLRFFKQIIGYLLIKFSFRSNDEILSIFLHNPSEKLFKKILKWLHNNNYKIISLKELEENLNKKIKKEKLAIITFDDGWIGNLNLLPSIEKYKTPIAIFIPTESVISGNYWFEYAKVSGQEKYSGIKKIQDFKKLPSDIVNKKIGILKNNYSLNRSCVKLEELELLNQNKFITIGSHTVTHPILKNCSTEVQQYELSQSKIKLQEWLNKEIEYFAYPNGDYNRESIKIAKKCNYKLCFTIHAGKIDIDKVDPYLIPRCCIDDNGGFYESIAKALGIWQKYFPKKGQVLIK